MTTAVFFFFFPLQRHRLLPFLQWCSNEWEEDDELRKADYGMGSAAVFVLLVALVSWQPAVVALPLLFCRCFFSLLLSPCFSPNNSLSLSLSLGFPSFSLFFCFARAPLLSKKKLSALFLLFCKPPLSPFSNLLLPSLFCSSSSSFLKSFAPSGFSFFFFCFCSLPVFPCSFLFFLPTFPSAPPPRVFIGRGGEVHHTLYKHRAWWPGHGSPVSPLMRVWVV